MSDTIETVSTQDAGMTVPVDVAEASYPANSGETFAWATVIGLDSAEQWFIRNTDGWNADAIAALSRDVADYSVSTLLGDPELFDREFVQAVEQEAIDACLDRLARIVVHGGLTGSELIH